MNYNNDKKATRLSAQMETFLQLSRSHQSKSYKHQIGDFREQIESIAFRLPAKYAPILLTFLEHEFTEIGLSHQDKLRFERLLREWASVAAAHEADMQHKLERIAAEIRPLIEQFGNEKIAQATASAGRARKKSSKQVESYRSQIQQFKTNHPQFADEADKALAEIAPIPAFSCQGANDAMVADPLLILKPLEDSLNRDLNAYENKLGISVTEAWDVWRSLPDADVEAQQ